MEIVVVRTDCTEHRTPLLAVLMLEREVELVGCVGSADRVLSGQISGAIARGDFSGREGETLLLFPRDETFPAERLLLVGVGMRDSLDLERLRRAAGTAVKQSMRLSLERMSLSQHHVELVADRISPGSAARALAAGLELGSYVFDELKTTEAGDPGTKRLARAEILASVQTTTLEIESGVRIGAVLGQAENFARDLGNLPGNIATPTYLADRAREISTRYGMSLDLLEPRELEREGLSALLAVARGSDEEPRLIVLEHRKGPPDQKPLVLIGKGITFDSGGISLKPGQGMEEMKFDMCGGAAVLGAMQAIGDLDAPVNVVGVVPATENLVSGKAYKPGDVIGTHLGKTVEVISTDAEGRLILADALSYVRRFDPVAIIDAATLTGACVVALGSHASAAFGNDEALIDEVREAGERVGERVWPMPMFEEYREQLKSDYADLKNSGGRPAGAVTAAWFLREFVDDTPWVHLDIAGTAWGDGKLPYQIKGATGIPTRLLVEWVLARAG